MGRGRGCKGDQMATALRSLMQGYMVSHDVEVSWFSPEWDAGPLQGYTWPFSQVPQIACWLPCAV